MSVYAIAVAMLLGILLTGGVSHVYISVCISAYIIYVLTVSWADFHHRGLLPYQRTGRPASAYPRGRHTHRGGVGSWRQRVRRGVRMLTRSKKGLPVRSGSRSRSMLVRHSSGARISFPRTEKLLQGALEARSESPGALASPGTPEAKRYPPASGTPGQSDGVADERDWCIQVHQDDPPGSRPRILRQASATATENFFFEPDALLQQPPSKAACRLPSDTPCELQPAPTSHLRRLLSCARGVLSACSQPLAVAQRWSVPMMLPQGTEHAGEGPGTADCARTGNLPQLRVSVLTASILASQVVAVAMRERLTRPIWGGLTVCWTLACMGVTAAHVLWASRQRRLHHARTVAAFSPLDEGPMDEHCVADIQMAAIEFTGSFEPPALEASGDHGQLGSDWLPMGEAAESGKGDLPLAAASSSGTPQHTVRFPAALECVVTRLRPRA